jgi:hypothetical protein
MNSDFLVLLDACVLVPAPLRDTLLRLAERRLFGPRWTDEIMEEMVRTLVVVQTLHEQADDLGRGLNEQLSVLKTGLPKFVELISDALYRRRE